MCNMRKINVRNLHLNTSAIVNEVLEGKAFVIEKQGQPVAELRPVSAPASVRRFPNRESLLKKFPRVKLDSGRILEEERS